MKPHIDDPLWTAYLLGELPETDRIRAEQLLREHPGLRSRVHQLDATLREMRDALTEETPAPAFDPLRAEAVRREADTHRLSPRVWIPTTIAALFAIGFGIAHSPWPAPLGEPAPPPSDPAPALRDTEETETTPSPPAPLYRKEAFDTEEPSTPQNDAPPPRRQSALDLESQSRLHEPPAPERPEDKNLAPSPSEAEAPVQLPGRTEDDNLGLSLETLPRNSAPTLQRSHTRKQATQKNEEGVHPKSPPAPTVTSTREKPIVQPPPTPTPTPTPTQTPAPKD